MADEPMHAAALPAEAAPRPPRSGHPDYPGLKQSAWLTCLVALTIVPLVAAQVALESLELDLSLWSDLAGSNVVAFGLVLWWGTRRSGLPRAQIFRFAAFAPTIVLPVVVLALGASIVISEIDNLLQSVLPMPEVMRQVMLDVLDSGWRGLFALIVVAPITEELLFRGLILRGLIAQRSVWSAILWSSLLFGLVHGNPWQLVGAFLVGVALGWIFVRTRSLLACMLLHAAFNGTAFAVDVIGLPIPGYSALSPPGTFQPPAFDLLGIALVAVSLLWLRRLFEREAKHALVRI